MTDKDHDMMMLDYMGKTIAVLVRGLVVCFAHVRLEKVLILMCAALGQQIAASYAGDELSTFKLRKMCRESFAKAMEATPVAALEPSKPPHTTASIGK